MAVRCRCLICQTNNLYLKPLANQKIKKIYTACIFSHSRKIKNKDVFEEKIQV